MLSSPSIAGYLNYTSQEYYLYQLDLKENYDKDEIEKALNLVIICIAQSIFKSQISTSPSENDN
jgi:hypothetical protein